MYSRLMPTVLLLLTWNTARLSDATSRVVGGHSAPREYGRYHVSLQNVNGQHVCGGVVISKKHLVTAAHCIYQAQPKYINAIVGTTNLDVGGKHYNISSITTHADYDHYYRLNDIAILTIKGLFDLNYVDILNLYEKELVEGDIVTLSGFGAQEPNGASSRIMYSLSLPVFNQDTCSYAMRYSSRNVTDRMFCTFSRIGQGPCHGDSGGPLVRHQRLVGLVSWGMPCAVGFPDVHTRITPYIDWIRKQTKYANCHIAKKRK